MIENTVRRAWTIADLSGHAHHTRSWPIWTQGRIPLSPNNGWLAETTISDDTFQRLLRPRVLLVALYHPEHFPLPRFPLAISDVARAARATLTGQVELMDMQLGVTLPDIVARTDQMRPDIVGISATFGQHDLMIQLMDHLASMPDAPLVIAGGSLTVRNERLLLQRYPRMLITRAAGEPTIQDVLAYWHGDLELPQVRGIGYHGRLQRGEGTLSIGPARRNAAVANRQQTDIWPELDLLHTTLAHGGVAQLETSRGCTSSCSFCPRGHKGQWSGAAPDGLPWILKEISDVFDQHPDIARVLYLVDEEFIGRGDDAIPRALAVSDILRRHRFRWETSCRIDQVVWPGRDRTWHVDRGYLWRALLANGLRRCLFGVESGVDTILERFHKETTSEQNALAIRTLSALGVPTRFTYITFDHLMTHEELRQTQAFQARTDLLLKPLPQMSVEEIIDGVRDEDFVAAHSLGTPFYTGISYMLVSMECLTGAAYTRKVQAAGLAGQVHPSIGRVDADFADRRIGVLSRWSQLWVDRNFALDYTFKSLEKILDGPPRSSIRAARVILKQAAFDLLTGMLVLLEDTDTTPSGLSRLDGRCQDLAETLMENLRPQMTMAAADVSALLPADRMSVLTREHTRWAATGNTWTLINASDPCGT
ncbi:hypothetical protein ABZ470_26240 [Streptosporangium sp. NPDC020072]|uniref:B12-binding domain-containing radical SAM protein n=1 Tax=Streptosporangium sp. NPDC020072 TaxID=3154788 RepID=UPI00343865BC